MRNRFIVPILAAAMISPAAFMVGCDKEVAHEEKTVKNADGTGSHTESTVKEKSDGSMEKTTEKKVDNKPDR